MAINLSTDTRFDIRQAVGHYVQTSPNSHLGGFTPREDIRSAFYILRSWIPGNNIQVAVSRLDSIARSMADM